jgi:glutamate N-acetyltransferase/amino-acid N-acetyltransferase
MSTPALEALEMISGGITTPKSFRAAGVSAGIKAREGALDLALIVSDRPATAAAVFTINRAQAAPVIVSRDHLARSGGLARAIIVNSGCANACTADEGLQTATTMAAETARLVDCPAEQVLVASTGVIGVALDIEKIRRSLPMAFASLANDQGANAAQAIMTTDPFPKEAAARLTIGGREITVGGMAKGSGMIEPMMATMLAFLTTDAVVPAPLLNRALRDAVNDTFNAITVDGECSTNDCVMLLASGASGAAIDESSYDVFAHAVRAVCLRLALGIVRGGEGATKLVTINVTGAAAPEEARRAAKAIANSPLVKTAVHGADPNWGRIVAAAGRSGGQFDISRTTVRVGDILLFENGLPHDEAAPEAGRHLQGTDVRIDVELGTGGGHRATIWTCDLTAEYVRINGEYRT